jgi:tRNA-specific 2-thiouridylase
MKPSKRKRIVLGIDDRIPSKIAASILRNQDFELVGVHLRIDLGAEEELYPTAFRRTNLETIEAACGSLGIPLKTIDVTDEVVGNVFEPYWMATLGGRADSPSSRWLRDILLPNLRKVATQFGTESIATGHFARLMGRVLRYVDPSLDQSLGFATIDEATLKALTLPLGEVSPDMLVRLARELGAIPKVEDDYDGSQGLEALIADLRGRGNWRWEKTLLSDPRLQAKAAGDFFKPGPVRSVEEFSMADHSGIAFHPIGSQAPEKLDQFVIDILPQSRTVIIGHETHLARGGAFVKGLSWTEKLKGRARERKILMRPLPSGNQPEESWLSRNLEPVTTRVWEYPGGLAEVHFETPLSGIAVGQTLVFLEESQVLGSATVVETQAPEKWVEKTPESE